MKYLATFIIVVSLFLFSFPRSAYASCVDSTNQSGFQLCVNVGGTNCGAFNNATQCCTLADECPVGSPGYQSSNTNAAMVQGRCGGAGDAVLETAIGCIRFGSFTETTQFFFRWAIGIAGGIVLLLIIYSGYIIITSTGDPKRLQSGQELLTSAIGGLLVIVFSVFILRFIGVNIIGIL